MLISLLAIGNCTGIVNDFHRHIWQQFNVSIVPATTIATDNYSLLWTIGLLILQKIIFGFARALNVVRMCWRRLCAECAGILLIERIVRNELRSLRDNDGDEKRHSNIIKCQRKLNKLGRSTRATTNCSRISSDSIYSNIHFCDDYNRTEQLVITLVPSAMTTMLETRADDTELTSSNYVLS